MSYEADWNSVAYVSEFNFMEKHINEYFTPKVQVKRARVISPDCVLNNNDNMADKVGDMTYTGLTEVISNVIGGLLDNKLAPLATKSDIQGLNVEINRLKEENAQIKQELLAIKSREAAIASKLDDLECRSRRNNIIFRGVKCNRGEDCKTVIKNFCVNMLQCGDNLWVNRAHPLGTSGLLIAHFPEDADVNWIMSKGKTLKGTGYYVSRDYSQEVRAKRGVLMAVRKELERRLGRRKMQLMFDHLVIEGVKFTWTGGKLCAGAEDGCCKIKEILNTDIADFVQGLVTNLNTGTSRQVADSSGTSRTADTQRGAGQSGATTGTEATTQQGQGQGSNNGNNGGE